MPHSLIALLTESLIAPYIVLTQSLIVAYINRQKIKQPPEMQLPCCRFLSRLFTQEGGLEAKQRPEFHQSNRYADADMLVHFWTRSCPVNPLS